MSDKSSLFDLNKHKLDEEWLAQVKKMASHSLELADAKAVYERAKAKRDVVEAEVELDIRKNPVAYDIAKGTEGEIKKAVLLQERYRKSHDAVLNAKHDVDIKQAYVDALDHRKKALENLTVLQGRDYYSDYVAIPEARKRKDDAEYRAVFNRKKGGHG